MPENFFGLGSPHHPDEASIHKVRRPNRRRKPTQQDKPNPRPQASIKVLQPHPVKSR